MVNLILECIAVLMAILYLVLAAKEDVKCWYAALISSLIYIYIMYQADLFMESILQVFYVLMAIYGWLQWKNIINTNIVLNIKSWKKIESFFCNNDCSHFIFYFRCNIRKIYTSGSTIFRCSHNMGSNNNYIYGC